MKKGTGPPGKSRILAALLGNRGHMFGRLAFVIGSVVAASGIAMLPAAAVSFIYREWEIGWGIALASAVTFACGAASRRIFGRPGNLTTKEGFAAVGLSWLAMSLFGTLPYLLSGAIGNATDAFFETASGFTTTGASVVPDPSLLPHGILLWRSLTQWIGGMGVILLSLAVLPLLGSGGVQLARAESPGPEPDRLTPRFRETAKRLWYVYALITLAEALLLWAGDMNLFQAVNHAFTTMSTGGFGTEAASIGSFGAYTQWVVIVFMFLAGSSFALHFRAVRDPGRYWRNTEFRLYAAIILAAAVIIAGGLWGSGAGDDIRNSLFTAVSLITTTGYATADFGLWIPALQILVVGLMFVGGDGRVHRRGHQNLPSGGAGEGGGQRFAAHHSSPGGVSHPLRGQTGAGSGGGKRAELLSVFHVSVYDRHFPDGFSVRHFRPGTGHRGGGVGHGQRFGQHRPRLG